MICKSINEFSKSSRDYAPFVGRVWVPFLYLVRILFVACLGSIIYKDESQTFICSTLTPGCRNKCFNAYSPIPHIRFWVLQILFVGIPSMMFIVYSMNSFPQNNLSSKQQGSIKEISKLLPESKQKDSLTNTGNDEVFSNDFAKNSTTAESENQSEQKLSNLNTNPSVIMKSLKIPQNIFIAYFIQLITRIVIEAIFLGLQCWLLKFTIPDMYVCEVYPCPRNLDCFIRNPQEKTAFLALMYVTTILSIILSVVEMGMVLYKLANSSSDNLQVTASANQPLLLEEEQQNTGETVAEQSV